MALTLLTGGARSGKSRLATEMAAAAKGPVTLIATAEARDADMAARIGRHRRERPIGWATLEEPRDLEGALDMALDGGCVIIDCLTLWVSNLIEQDADDRAVLAHARAVARLAASKPGDVVAVTNEVGWGIVPANGLGRRYRDLLGEVNAIWAAAAHRAVLVVAGRIVVLAPTADLMLPEVQ